jgi:hypothetical protein
VLVANNAYVLELPSVGERERLDEGKLHLYCPGADPAERVDERFVVDAAAGRLEAAVDGEPSSGSSLAPYACSCLPRAAERAAG